jgi:hypothetical protein
MVPQSSGAPASAAAGSSSIGAPANLTGPAAIAMLVAGRLKEYATETFKQVRPRARAPAGCVAHAAAQTGRTKFRGPATRATPHPPPPLRRRAQRKPWSEVLDKNALSKPANLSEARRNCRERFGRCAWEGAPRR